MKIGSSKIKQRAQLRTTAPNNEWFKNVIKSIGYASADIIKETIPSTFEFVESNGKEALDLYQQLREDGPKSITKMVADGASKNQYIKIANEAISNIKDDIKTGKLYNKEREEKSVYADGDDDFEFTFGEDDEDFSFGGDDETESEEIDDGSVTNIKKVTVNNINANITKNNPMVQSLEKQSEMIVGLSEATNKTNIGLATTSYTLTSKISSDIVTGLGSVNDNLSALVNFNNDSMSKYVAASLQYYEDSLNMMRQTLEHNTPATNNTTQTDDEPELFLSNGGLNIGGYVNRVKKNVKNTIESDLMLNSIYSVVNDTDTLRMLAANPFKAATMAMSKVIIPSVIRDSAKQFDDTFSAFFPALLQRFNRMANQDDNWIVKTIGQIFGYNPKISTSVQIDKYNKGDMNFNGITQKAITEVIPTYLRKILSAISGNNEMLFDYQNGKFVDYMKASENVKKEDRQSLFSSMEMYSELKSRLNAIEFTDEKYKKQMMSEFDDFMYRLARSGGGVNPNVIRQKDGTVVDELKDMYSSEFTEIFRSAILSLSPAQQMKLMGEDLFNAKVSYGRRIDQIQNEIGQSLVPILQAWDSSSDYKKDDKTDTYSRKDPLSHLKKDKYDKTSLDYLREMRNILLEGIIVFPNGNSSIGASDVVGDDSQTLYSDRKKRLTEIGQETDKVKTKELENATRVIKNYTPTELKNKASRGIKVVDSTSDLLANMNNSQMMDLFKNYVQIRDADEETEKQQKNADSWFYKIFSKGGKKVQNVRDLFDNIVSLPGRVVSNVLSELDDGLYKLVFGVNPDGSDRSFLSKVTTSIKESFGGFFDWTKEKFFKPINEALFGEDGFFTKIKNSQAMEKLKAFSGKMADWAFGNLDETGHRRNGAFSDAFNEVADLGKEVGSVFTGKEYVDRNGNVHEGTSNSVLGNINGFTGEVWRNGRDYLFGNRQKPKKESFQQMNLDDYMASMSNNKNNEENNEEPKTSETYEQMDLFGQMGNGGENFLDKVKSWFKDNVKLRYSVSTNDNAGEAKTINFGESVNEEIGSGGFAPTMLNGFPYFSQRDPRYANYAYNLSTGKGGGDSLAFGDRGCGPTALAMVASGLGIDTDPIDMADIATESGYSVEGGTKGSFFSSIGNKLGLNVKEKQTDESKVNSAIRDGKPIIFRGRKTTDNITPFTSEGHFVVGVGGKNGKININDPNGMMTSGEYDVKDIVSESNKMWTFDDTGKGPSTNSQQPTNLGVGDWIKDVSKDGSYEIKGVFGELAEGFQSAGDDIIRLFFGEREGNEDDETKASRFGNKFREMLPKGIAGGIIGGGLGTIVAGTGGMGILGSMFLPGGPIGGAVLGTAVGFLSQSEKFKNWLFGEKDPEDTSKRLGGFISAKTQKFVKDNKSTIIGGAAIGGLKGMLSGAGLLPSLLFGGPLTGAILGAGVGLAVRSEKFQNMIFGKDDPETGKKIGGALSKSYNAIADNKKLIGGAGIGLLGGAAAGTVLSSMGILGSAFFLGPVGGAIAGAGLGIAAASEKWRDKVFGTLNEKTNKREGGLLQDLKHTIIGEVLEPIKLGAIETADSFKYWFEEKVMLPVADFFGPMKSALGMMLQDTMWAVQDIGAGVKATFEKYIGEPAKQFLHDKLFKPVKDLFGLFWQGGTALTQTVLGAPFKMLQFANKGAASLVESKANKRKEKYDAYNSVIELFEQKMENGPLSLEDNIRYETLKKKRDRYYIAEDDKRLRARKDYDQQLAERQKEITTRKDNAKADLLKRKTDLQNRNEFRRIFGSEYEYNEEALTKYKSLFSLEDGKKVKGRRARKALSNKAEEFIRNFKSSGGEAPSDENVKVMKDEIKDNLSPMRKALEAIETNIQSMGVNIQNGLNSIINKMLSKSSDENTIVGSATKSFKATVKGVKRKGKALKFMALRTADGVKYVADTTADAVKHGANVVIDEAGKVVDGAVQGVKTATDKVVGVADNITNNAVYNSEQRLSEAMAEKERLKKEREKIKDEKAKAGEGSGGRKDPSWLMYGKGDEEKPKKKGGFLSSLTDSMFGALKRFDKVNDKEEEEKAENKEAKAQLADKQKDVSSKSYSLLKSELDAKNKEAEEKEWKGDLLDAVLGIRDKTQEHSTNWSDIFSKKGLITAGLVLALPKIVDFFKDPSKFIKETISNLINNIKISIDWLFGEGNDSRTDANGETIENGGLQDATTRLTRNTVMKGARYLAKEDTVGNKAVRAGAKVGKAIYNTGKEFMQYLNLSDGAMKFMDAGVKSGDDLVRLGVTNPETLIKQGVNSYKDLAALGLKNSDELAKVGITSADHLAKFGVKTTKDLAALGLKNTDELAKVGIKTTDDIAKFGVNIASKDAAKQLSKVGIKVSEELVDSQILATGAKSTIGQKMVKVADALDTPLASIAKSTSSAVTNAGKAIMNSSVGKAAKSTTSAVVNAGQSAMNTKFVSAITDWIKTVFGSNSIRKQLGESVAAKTIKELTSKVVKALDKTILSKFAKQISLAIAKTTGRVSTAVATLGIGTALFGVADFISGAVNTERLFEIPAGTATWEMELISATLQTALGLYMVGPIIDVANEIIAEVTGINFISMMAITIYELFVDDDKEIELSNLRAELDAAYTAYKEVNGLDDLSKKAYIDLTNPSLGTKVWNGAKNIGNTLTGNFFNTDKIRQTLGKEDGEKVTISDRISQLTGSTLGGLSFGLINGDEVTRNVANGLNKAKQWGSDTWKATKDTASYIWNNKGQIASDAWKATKQWGSDTWNDAKRWGSETWNDAKQWGSDTWNDAKQWGSDTWNGTKEVASNVWNGTKEAASNAWNGTKQWASNTWDDTKEVASNVWNGTKDIASKALDVTTNTAKNVGNFVTGNIFNDDEIRRQLGLSDNVDVTLKDRLSMGAATIIERMSLGKIDTEDSIRKIQGIQSSVYETVSDVWNSINNSVKEFYNDKKDKLIKLGDSIGKKITGSIGLLDENGDPLPFGEGMAELKVRASEAIKNTLNDAVKFASDTWTSVKEKAKSVYDTAKENILDTADKMGRKITGLFGLLDENGDPLPFGEGMAELKTIVSDTIKNKVNSAVKFASDTWDSVKEKAENVYNTTKDNIVNTADKMGRKITGFFGLLDENGDPLPFGEGMAQLKVKAPEAIKNAVNDAKQFASDTWTSVKEKTVDVYNTTKDNIVNIADNFGRKITGYFGLVDDEGNPLPFNEGVALAAGNLVTSVKNSIITFKESASDFWAHTKETASEWYTTTKENIVNGIDEKNKEFGALFGFKDDKGNDLSLTEGVKFGVTKAVKGISKTVTGITDTVTSFWNTAGNVISKGLNDIGETIKGIPDAINKFFGGLLGFKDDNGEPMKLTEGIKNGWTKAISNLTSWLNSKEEKANQEAAARNAAANIAASTNGNGGYGGFGEEIPQNIGARGCGPTAMAMVTSRITGAQVDPVMMSNLATEAGFAGNYGTNGAYFNYAANQFGISSTESKTTKGNLTKALSSGQPVILRGQSNGEKSSAFTRAGHYVVAVGAKDGKVIINDPRGEQYSGAYDMTDVVNQSNVMWSFGNARGAYDRGTSIVFGGDSTNTVPGELITQYALIHKGKPYVWGGNGPKNFDCSGLVNYVCKQAGIKLPSSRPTAEVWRKHCTQISKNDLKVGDLGFLVKNGKATHVGIYAGDGLWCHAEGGPGENGAGGSVVLNDRTYWTHYGRIPGVSGNTSSYSETSGVSALSFGSTNTGTASYLTNITGYLSDVFTNGLNSAITGQVGSFKTYSEYVASNNSDSSSTSSSYTDTVGTVSLGSRKTTSELLNKTLSGRLSGKGSTIVSIGNKYGVDPAFLAALMHHESGNGTSNAIINFNNPGGIMDASSGWSTLKSFPSLDSGIEYTAKNLKNNYLDQGLTTIPKIGAKYAPVGAANDPTGLNNYWVNSVSNLYNKYSSETGYGGFGEGFAPLSETTEFRFGDKASEFGGMGNYIGTIPTNQMDFSNNESDDKVVNVMETMVEVLKTIAENTSATSSNIKDAIGTAISKISSSTSSNINVNSVTTNGNKVVKTSAAYSAKEKANRSIAEKIAAGKFA